MNPLANVLFLYLGRSGALGRFTLELAHMVTRIPHLKSTLILSRTNENVSDFFWLGDSLLTVDTFHTPLSFSHVLNLLATRRRILDRIRVDNVSAVVNLMPHIWTPLLARAIQSRGIKYITIVHDAVRHPGDQTSRVVALMRNEVRSADLVVTLSRTVADALINRGSAQVGKVLTLFHPDVHYVGAGESREGKPHIPLRVLFLGRILRYKGLPLLIEAVEALRREGIEVQLGVAGSGPIGDLRARLTALDAEVINHWLADGEIASLLSRYDAIALPHIEASQSGIAAAAFGNYMPVVAMPSGGLIEQVVDGETGVVAEQVTASSFAEAIRRLALNPALYRSIAGSLKTTAHERSMERFVNGIMSRL